MRELQAYTWQVESVKIDTAQEPDAWLCAQGQALGAATLLAHADDGVIWGCYRESKLALSGDDAHFSEISPPLRWQTLQDARFFGPAGELFIWRIGEGQFAGRTLRDQRQSAVGTTGEATRWALDESQWLWGTRCVDEQGGFTQVAEGQQGQQHAVPLTGLDFTPLKFGSESREQPWHPLRLDVRHYCAQRDDGTVAIINSRLVRLRAESAPLAKEGQDATA